MRVAVVYFAPSKHSRIIALANALAKGIENQGHQVDIIDGSITQNKKLIIYQYIALGTEQTSILGKISLKISHLLASQGTLQGKKGFAFITKKPFGTPRALLRLMSAMEKEGILVKNSEIVTSQEQANETGKLLHINT